MNQRWMRNSMVYLLILVAVVAIFYMVFGRSFSSERQEELGTVIELAQLGQVNSVEVDGDKLKVSLTSGEVIRSRKESGASVFELLQQNGVPTTGNGAVEVKIKTGSSLGSFFGLLINFLPLIFFGGLLLFMMRQAQGSNSQAMNFARSRARMMIGNKPNVTFNDVAGVEEAKQELQEVVEFLKFPEKFSALGAKIPKGVLLVGSPGTGKTLLAKAVAGEAGVPFFSISGSEFVEMFVGVGASRVRDLFEQAKRNSPCIIFIDEIDAVGRHRGAGLGGGHDEREQTLNQILVEMDGFETGTNVILLAATNRPDILDPALLRPGRFDRRVILDQPDIGGRKAILQVHSNGKPLAPDVDLEVLAKLTPGFTGADLANLTNEGAILAARRNRKNITMVELEEAIDRVIAGPERKSRIINQREKKVTAYHEAGHALVATKLKDADPVHKISVVARGTMGGYTRMLPVEDRYLHTKSQFEAMLATALGGRTAELVVFEETTTGAGNDLEQATKLARQMITRYGMSERLGPRTFGKKEELIFLGREISEERDYSDKIAELIDEEVNAFMQLANETAHGIMKENIDKLHQLATAVFTKETLEGDELRILLDCPSDLPLEEIEKQAKEAAEAKKAASAAASSSSDEEDEEATPRPESPAVQPGLA